MLDFPGVRLTVTDEACTLTSEAPRRQHHHRRRE